MNRRRLLDEVERRLDSRSVVWAGIRGDDLEPLADLPNVTASFTIIGRYTKRTSIAGVAYEDLTQRRVDLETWDIDDHLDVPATVEFRRALMRQLSEPSALLPYRPSRFLSAIWFARQSKCLNLGLFGAHQAAFEHKPWVESAVRELGVPCVPWTYVADEEQVDAQRLVAKGPVILRPSRTSGGQGIVRADNADEVTSRWPVATEAFVSVSPYLEDSLPLNVGGTVWRDGVTVHRPSVQLIGIPSCVTRPFGYCGNDFAAASLLEAGVLDQIEQSTQTVGNWLAGFGYRGTFGVDFLMHEGVPLFTEVNARFQGSTHASCQLSIENGESCLMLEHIAAVLGLPAPQQPPLRHEGRGERPLAHVVLHWTGAEPAHLNPQPFVSRVLRERSGSRADVLANPELLVDPGAAAARITVREQVTDNGYALNNTWRQVMDGWMPKVDAHVRTQS